MRIHNPVPIIMINFPEWAINKRPFIATDGAKFAQIFSWDLFMFRTLLGSNAPSPDCAVVSRRQKRSPVRRKGQGHDMAGMPAELRG